MQHWILFLSDEALSAYYRKNRQWICGDRFIDAPEDLARFTQFLQSHQHSNFQLLAELACEEMLTASIPRTRSKDRQALMARKLEQLFPGQQLRVAISLSEEHEPKREVLRFAAFSRFEKFSPWLERLSANHCRLDGVFSTSQLLGSVLRDKHKQTSSCLLFLQSGAMLHQYFLRHGEVHFSRTSNTTTDENVMQEALKLQHYLLKQQLIERGEILPVLTSGCSAADFSQTNTLDFQPLPDGKQIFDQLLDSLRKRAPKTQFAPPSFLRAARLSRIRSALNWLTALILSLALPATAFHMQEIKHLAEETGAMHIRQQEFQQPAPIEEESTKNPSSTDLHFLTDSHQQLRGPQAHPKNALVKLSQVLDQHPEIQLAKLDWQAGSEQETLLVEGYLSNNSSAAQSSFAHFLAALQVDRASQVKLLQSITGHENKEKLRGDSQQSAPALQNFILEVSRQP